MNKILLIKIIIIVIILIFIFFKLISDKYEYQFYNSKNTKKDNSFNYNFNSILFYISLLILFFVFISSIIYINNNILFNKYPIYYTYFFIIYLIFGLFLFLILIYHLIYILYTNTNRFNKNLVKNNTYLVFNIITILIFTYILYKLFFGKLFITTTQIKKNIIYNLEDYKDKDDGNYLLYLYNTILLNIYNSDKYFITFIFLCLTIIFLYLFNPFGIMNKYATNSFYIILFCVFISICLIYFYRLFNILDKWYDKEYVLFIQIIYIIFSLTISGLLLYWIFINLGFTKKKQNNPIRIFFNLMLIIFCLSIIYKLLELNDYINNKYFKLFLDILLYIPCIFLILIDIFINNINLNLENLRKDTIILFLAIMLITLYLVTIKIIIPKILISYYTQGGKQFLNCNTIPLNISQNIATYEELNEINNEEIIDELSLFEYREKIYYNSCLSFWFYIESFNTSVNVNYNKYIPIFTYGNMLFVKYNASKNTLQITNIKYVNDTIPSNDENILYEHNNILLQKWNNLVLNYNSGTLDIFLNNILVKTIINFTNYVKYDSLLIGYNNGVYGDICNILYFKKSVDRDIIKLLYDLYKNLNPPCLDLKNVKKIV